MVFSSLTFIFLFLPIVLLGNSLTRGKVRNIFLLVMSFIFYSWGEPKFILLMITSIIINWLFGLLIEDQADKAKLWLTLCVTINLGILFYFKYFNFIIDNINSISKYDIQNINVVLPIGISFYTFQSISYIVDLYRGHYKAQRSFINLALYICLFPQLIAGPIVRYIDINSELENREVTLEKSAQGIKRFCAGFAKKIIFANTFAQAVKYIAELKAEYLSGAIGWMCVVLTALFIYYDFSGYSDMAIGLGKMLGFDFLENFDHPFVSTSVSEFWRRWHISLSSWFKDYLYIPLGGNKRGNVYFNLFAIFLATGIWHGAAWNYIAWGVWNGIFVLIERAFLYKHIKNRKIIGYIYTFIAMSPGWIIFQYGIREGVPILFKMVNIIGKLPSGYYSFTEVFSMKVIVLTIIGYIFSLENKRFKEAFNRFKYAEGLKLTACMVLFVISLIMLIGGTYNPFIYFRF